MNISKEGLLMFMLSFEAIVVLLGSRYYHAVLPTMEGTGVSRMLTFLGALFTFSLPGGGVIVSTIFIIFGILTVFIIAEMVRGN